MRFNVTLLPAIVGAVLMGAAFITRSEPAPEPARSYFATLVGRELVWGKDHVPAAGQKVVDHSVDANEMVFSYGVPRIATQLEGDLSPIGAVFQEQDFPAFALTCMAIGFAKWVDGGRDFYRHWYQWWVR